MKVAITSTFWGCARLHKGVCCARYVGGEEPRVTNEPPGGIEITSSPFLERGTGPYVHAKGALLLEAYLDAPVACHRPCSRTRRGPADRRRRRCHDELRGRYGGLRAKKLQFLRPGRHRRGPHDVYEVSRHRLSHG